MYKDSICFVFSPLALSYCFLYLNFISMLLKNAEQGKIESKGLNPGLIVLLVIGGLLVTFLVGNFILYTYAQKNLPPKKKKPLSKKKMKKEKMKQGVQVPGE